MAAPTATRRFLGWLFGHESVATYGRCILIWSLPSHKAHFFPAAELDEAAVTAQKLSLDKQDVYFGLGLMEEPPNEGRGKLTDIDGITCVWADLDYGDQVKAGGKKPPPNQAAARELASETGLEPSIVIHSGHGLQCYWLLDSPLLFSADDALHEEATTLAQGWVQNLQTIAATHGWHIDAVGDLTRVFRPPGTTNYKQQPIKVKLLEPTRGKTPEKHYTKEELWISIASHSTMRSEVKSLKVKKPYVDEDTKEIIKQLCTNDPKFNITWKRERKDLSDPSASGYDLSIASQMAIAGCNNQVIANALLYWRIIHNEDQKKIQRTDYLSRTITRARARESKESKKETSKWSLDKVKERLKIPLRKLLKIGRENCLYSLILEDETDIYIGRSTSLLNQALVRAQIADSTNIVIPLMKQLQWHQLIEHLLQNAETRDNPELPRLEQIEDWLQSYLGAVRVFSEDQWQQAVVTGEPFKRDGYIHVNSTSFRQYLLTTGERLSRDALLDLLRVKGAEITRIGARVKEEFFHKRYWRLKNEH